MKKLSLLTPFLLAPALLLADENATAPVAAATLKLDSANKAWVLTAMALVMLMTPAAGFVDNSAALIIGAVAGIVGFVGVNVVKKAFKYNDALDEATHGEKGFHI